MFYIACIRFSNKTYEENMNYRIKYEEPVIYGLTLKIREKYPIASLIFVVEMNNDTNKIEGIGLIKNLLVHDKRHKIYDNNEYNRYIYRGKYWLNREQINDYNKEIVEIFDNILFKGKSHLKRRLGITVITEKLFVHWNYELHVVKNMVRDLFLVHFKYNINDELINEEEEYFEIIPKKRKIIKNINTINNV